VVTAKFGGTGGGGKLFDVTCARCAVPREMPEPNRPRMPAINADGSTTIDSDTACACGSMRVRVTLTI
jgi:hypothetical protein